MRSSGGRGGSGYGNLCGSILWRTRGLNTTHQGTLPMRLSRRHRLYLYVIGGSLVASGVAWLIAHYLLAAPSEFGETHHPSEPWWLRHMAPQ